MVMRAIMFVTLTPLPFLSSFTLAELDCIGLQEIWGRYDVVEVSRYRGGLTSQSEANENIGKSTLVSEEGFSFWGKVNYASPIYDMTCQPIPLEEGEVTVRWERKSDFYGIGMDRDVVNELKVTPVQKEGPRYHFEVVQDELWFFFDGWFYRMERVGRD